MADIHWVGNALAVSQVETFQVTAFDASTTYDITINGIVISTLGVSSVNATAAALQVLLDASTHPYFSTITWSVLTDTITATGPAGSPFIAGATATGGTGTIGAGSITTTHSGPNDWDTDLNWSGGAVPVSADNVTIKDSSNNIAWGLDQNAVDLGNFIIEKSYTGLLGLRLDAFATDGAGVTNVTTATEYRDHYLIIGYDNLDIGENISQGSPAGSRRIKIDNDKAGSSTITVHDTATTSTEVGLPSVRFLFGNSGQDLFVRKAPGGVGVAVDEANETSTMGDVNISDTTTTAQVFIAAGVTITTFTQLGGNNVLQAAATMTSITLNGGLLRTEGDYTITTATNNSGTWTCNHIKTAGDAITTLNVNGGLVDGLLSSEARIWGIVNLEVGGRIRADDSFVTITTLNEPSGVPYTLSAS